MRIFLILFLLLGTLSNSWAVVSKETCIATLSELGLKTGSYQFKDGWLTDKHIFESDTECYEKEGNIFVSVDRKVFVEDGFFGLQALEARDQIISSRNEKDKELQEIRDDEIAAAKSDYDEAQFALKQDTESQLQSVRSGNTPESVKAQIQATNSKQAEKQAKKTAEIEAKKAAKQAEQDDEKRRGFHCLSGWNGSHREVVKLIKSQLNDPGSFDHDETRVAPVENGRHKFFMRYRAKNGFGAVVVGNATGTYGHDDCEDVEISAAR